MPTVTSHAPNDADKKFWDRLKAAMVTGTSEDGLDNYRALALASQFVGMLLAIQDQRARSKEAYSDTIVKNIEQGNADFINNIFTGAAEQ